MNKAIKRVANFLDKEKIPYEMGEVHDGMYIGVKLNSESEKYDLYAAQHYYSIGGIYDKIEISGGLTEQELEKDNVLGYLPSVEVGRRFSYCYVNQTTIYKKEEK